MVSRWQDAGDNSRKVPSITHYLLSVYQPDGPMPSPEVLQEIPGNLEAFHKELTDAGAWVFAGGLHVAGTATVVKLEDGGVLMTDGPYMEGKEHLGGLCIVEAPDLDAALEWGKKATRATTLPIEVRLFQGEQQG